MEKRKFETQREAYDIAFKEFMEKGSEQFFSGQFATHYYVQKLSNGTVSIVFGGAGTVTNADETYSPVSAINGAFNIPDDSIKGLAELFKALFPDSESGDEQ